MQTKLERGFTLVEVLVISPIIILFIGAFITLIVTLTGESIQLREKNVATYDTQNAFDEIESSAMRANGFLYTTGTVASPQGSNNATAAFTNTADNILIMTTAATTGDPNSTSRSLIYTGTGACDSRNPIYSYITVYFLALDPDTTSNTTDRALYKRTILPQVPACAAAWQRGSCAEAVVSSNTTVCKASDEKLMGNVESFNVSFFSGSTAVARENASTANSISVSINSSKQVSGSPVTYDSSITTTSQNVITSDSAPPTPAPAPSIAWTRDPNGPTPYQTTFSWQPAGNARATNGYTVTPTIGGVVQPSQNLPGSQTSFNVSARWRKEIVSISLVVNTDSGSYSYGTQAATATPSWNDCVFSGQGGWDDYIDWYGGGPFTRAGYTRTSSGIVGLKGLVKGTTLNVPICTLPVGFRPKFAGEKLIFQVAACCSNWGRIDIYANGDVVPVQGNTEWFSLDGIMFMSDTTTSTSTAPWTNRSWQNGWTQYPSGHTTLRSTTDSQGRVHVQGLGSYPGTSPNYIYMTSGLPAATNTLHYPAMSGGPGIVQFLTNGAVQTRSSPNSYQQIQAIYRPSGSTGWQNMPFSSGWDNYYNGFPTMQCHRGSDDVVIVQGLIRHPTDGNGAYIGDTGPCGRLRSGKGDGVEDRMILAPWTSNEAPGRIDMINGVSLLSQGTAAGWTALDGFHFIAD